MENMTLRQVQCCIKLNSQKSDEQTFYEGGAKTVLEKNVAAFNSGLQKTGELLCPNCMHRFLMYKTDVERERRDQEVQRDIRRSKESVQACPGKHG